MNPEYAVDLLKNPQNLERQRTGLAELVKTLDRRGASMNVAKIAMEMTLNRSGARCANA